MELVTDFLNNHTDATVVWLADRQELLGQAIKEFKRIWKHRGTKSLTLNRAWDQYEYVESISGSRLIIFGLDKLISFFINLLNISPTISFGTNQVNFFF